MVASQPETIYSADGVAMPEWVKDPFDVLDYTLDWSDMLDPSDTIIACVFVVEPDNELTVLSTNFTSTTATCWLQAGLLGVTYSVSCQIITDAGREEERTFMITCGQN